MADFLDLLHRPTYPVRRQLREGFGASSHVMAANRRNSISIALYMKPVLNYRQAYNTTLKRIAETTPILCIREMMY